MTVKGNHPLGEIVARKLFGIGSCPPEIQSRMVRTAAKSAAHWHEEQVTALRAEIERKDGVLKKIVSTLGPFLTGEEDDPVYAVVWIVEQALQGEETGDE